MDYLYKDVGEDSRIVGSVDDGYVYSGTGDDSYSVGSFDDEGYIYSGVGEDSYIIGKVDSEGYVYSGVGGDSLSAGKVDSDGYVYSGVGEDCRSFGKAEASDVYGAGAALLLLFDSDVYDGYDDDDDFEYYNNHDELNFNVKSSSTTNALKIAEIKQLLESGNKIAAIKIYREIFGGSLRQAKDAVEAMGIVPRYTNNEFTQYNKEEKSNISNFSKSSRNAYSSANSSISNSSPATYSSSRNSSVDVGEVSKNTLRALGIGIILYPIVGFGGCITRIVLQGSPPSPVSQSRAHDTWLNSPLKSWTTEAIIIPLLFVAIIFFVNLIKARK